LLPLYIPGLLVIKQMWKKNPMMALVSLVVYTGVYALVGWLNESWGVRKLQAERARIAGLYEE
jgi:hypothetical protein